jgi:hypothetical protein
VPSIVVRAELSSADPAIAIEHAGDASARAGSPGTAAPLALRPTGAGTDEPAPPDVQPAQTATTPTATNATLANEASARDIAAQTPIPRWYV